MPRQRGGADAVVRHVPRARHQPVGTPGCRIDLDHEIPRSHHRRLHHVVHPHGSAAGGAPGVLAHERSLDERHELLVSLHVAHRAPEGPRRGLREGGLGEDLLGVAPRHGSHPHRDAILRVGAPLEGCAAVVVVHELLAGRARLHLGAHRGVAPAESPSGATSTAILEPEPVVRAAFSVVILGWRRRRVGRRVGRRRGERRRPGSLRGAHRGRVSRGDRLRSRVDANDRRRRYSARRSAPSPPA